eukprot:3893893-Pleurochrysis_carterae.AAC.1
MAAAVRVTRAPALVALTAAGSAAAQRVPHAARFEAAAAPHSSRACARRSRGLRDALRRQADRRR